MKLSGLTVEDHQLCELLYMEIHDSTGYVHAENRNIRESNNELQHLLRIGLEFCR